MALTPNVYLEFDIDNKRGRVVDNSNYSENDINLAELSAKGLGTVTSPTGDAILVANTTSNPLVNLQVSTNGQWFNLPLDTNGNVLNGTYSFTYSVRYAIVNGTINSITATSTAELEFVHAGSVLEAGDSIVFADNGDTENNGTFTIATATYDTETDNSTITVTATTLLTDATPSGTYSFDITRSNFAGNTYTFNGCDFVTLSVQSTYDCESTQLGQITFQDVTNYNGQTVSKVLTGYYPNALNPAPSTPSVSTTTSSLTFNELAVGTWSHKLVSTMSVTQTDGLVYTYTLTDTGETKVTCIGTLCGLTPCLESLKDNFMANYQKGTANNLIPILTQVNTLYMLAKEYKTCGEYEKYKNTVAELETVLDASGLCSCGCCDESTDVPYWVDNANQGNSILTELFAQIGGLEYIVASNTAAQAAYNTLMSDLNSILADAVELNTELNTIQSAILSLNPSSDTFDDDVQAILDNLDLANANTLALQIAINDWNNDLGNFNTLYPQYQSYTVAAATLLNAVSTAIDAIPADIAALYDLLEAITSATFLDDIADIQAQIEIIIQSIGSIVFEIYQMQSTLTEISNTISYILQTLVDLQNQIDAIDVNTYKVAAIFVDEELLYSGNLYAYVPTQFMQEKTFVKFSISGSGVSSGDALKLVNTNTSYNILSFIVDDKTFKIDLELRYYAASNTYRIGGSVIIDSVLTTVVNSTINIATEIVLGDSVVFALVVGSGTQIDIASYNVMAYKIL